MVCYINFKIDGRELMINEDNPDDVKMWKTHGNRGIIEKSTMESNKNSN